MGGHHASFRLLLLLGPRAHACAAVIARRRRALPAGATHRRARRSYSRRRGNRRSDTRTRGRRSARATGTRRKRGRRSGGRRPRGRRRRRGCHGRGCRCLCGACETSAAAAANGHRGGGRPVVVVRLGLGLGGFVIPVHGAHGAVLFVQLGFLVQAAITIDRGACCLRVREIPATRATLLARRRGRQGESEG